MFKFALILTLILSGSSVFAGTNLNEILGHDGVINFKWNQLAKGPLKSWAVPYFGDKDPHLQLKMSICNVKGLFGAYLDSLRDRCVEVNSNIIKADYKAESIDVSGSDSFSLNVSQVTTVLGNDDISNYILRAELNDVYNFPFQKSLNDTRLAQNIPLLDLASALSQNEGQTRDYVFKGKNGVAIGFNVTVQNAKVLPPTFEGIIGRKQLKVSWKSITKGFLESKTVPYLGDPNMGFQIKVGICHQKRLIFDDCILKTSSTFKVSPDKNGDVNLTNVPDIIFSNQELKLLSANATPKQYSLIISLWGQRYYSVFTKVATFKINLNDTLNGYFLAGQENIYNVNGQKNSTAVVATSLAMPIIPVIHHGPVGPVAATPVKPAQPTIPVVIDPTPAQPTTPSAPSTDAAAAPVPAPAPAPSAKELGKMPNYPTPKNTQELVEDGKDLSIYIIKKSEAVSPQVKPEDDPFTEYRSKIDYDKLMGQMISSANTVKIKGPPDDDHDWSGCDENTDAYTECSERVSFDGTKYKRTPIVEGIFLCHISLERNSVPYVAQTLVHEFTHSATHLASLNKISSDECFTSWSEFLTTKRAGLKPFSNGYVEKCPAGVGDVLN